MAQHLYPGCDVWLNNPLRPFEACGTSGMKAALNGGLNLSILDGWWDEWFDGQNGWAIPTADGVEDADRRDDLEAAALYDLIENAVAPRFYDRDDDGLPQGWIDDDDATPCRRSAPRCWRAAWSRTTSMQLYGPAAGAGRALNGPEFAGAKDLAAYKAKVRAAWPSVKVEHVEPSGVSDSPQIGDTLDVKAYVDLGGLEPDEVEVQLVHGHVNDTDEIWGTEVAPLDARRVLRRRSPPVRRVAVAAAHRVVRLQRAHRAQAPVARDRGRARAGAQRLSPQGVTTVARQTRIDAGPIHTAVPAPTGPPGERGRRRHCPRAARMPPRPGAVGRVSLDRRAPSR